MMSGCCCPTRGGPWGGGLRPRSNLVPRVRRCALHIRGWWWWKGVSGRSRRRRDRRKLLRTRWCWRCVSSRLDRRHFSARLDCSYLKNQSGNTWNYPIPSARSQHFRWAIITDLPVLQGTRLGLACDNLSQKQLVSIEPLFFITILSTSKALLIALIKTIIIMLCLCII